MTDYVERIIISRSHPNWKACHRMCSCARKLGNCATYVMRHRIFEKLPVPTRKDFDHAVREQYLSDYRAMPSAASAQRAIQIVGKEFKSYAKASQEFKKHPEKFLGKPRLPGYKNRYRTFVVGRNGYHIQNSHLILTGGEEFGFSPLKIRCWCARHERVLKGESPKRRSYAKRIANSKGVHREMESEGSWRQTVGLTDRNHVRHHEWVSQPTMAKPEGTRKFTV